MGTLTPNLGLTVPTVGGDTGPLFAQEINGDLQILDSVYGGVNVLNVGGAANVTATTQQAQNLVQQLTGVLTGNIIYFLPAVGAYYAIENATTGSFALAIGCTGGANLLTIPQGLSTWVWTDGTTTRITNPPGWQEIATYSFNATSKGIIQLPAPFRRFRITLQNASLATAGSGIGLQGSNDGGASALSSGNQWTINNFNAGGGSVIYGSAASGPGGAGATFVPITGQASSANGRPIDAVMEIWPGTGGQFGTILGRSQWSDTTSGQVLNCFEISAMLPSGNINAVIMDVQYLSGTVTMSAIVEGLP